MGHKRKKLKIILKVSENHKKIMMSHPMTEQLSVHETMTIKELGGIIRNYGLYEKLSDKEFDEFILSRRPMELLLIANASLYYKSL